LISLIGQQHSRDALARIIQERPVFPKTTVANLHWLMSSQQNYEIKPDSSKDRLDPLRDLAIITEFELL